MPELRVDVPAEELSVLDGYCIATGRARVDLVRELISKFTSEQVHIAKIVLRTARINPLVVDEDRQTTPGVGK